MNYTLKINLDTSLDHSEKGVRSEKRHKLHPLDVASATTVEQ